MDKIRDRLWLGSWRDAGKAGTDFLVITVAIDSPFRGDHNFPMTDPGTHENDPSLMKEAIETLERRMKDSQKEILVHCVSGVNRSPSVVIGYLMKTEKLSMTDAHNDVKNRRHINPINQQLKNVKAAVGDTTSLDTAGFITRALTEHEEIVHKTYREILGRNADPDGLRHYSEYLAEHQGHTRDSLKKALMNSDEYRKKNAE